MLNAIAHGSPTDEPPLVIAHGLFGSARNWGVVAKRLSEDRQVVAVDMRNHGESLHDPDHSYAAQASDLSKIIAEYGGRADLMGHSMGGKAAMMLALEEPEQVGRLIVADMAPVAYSHTQMPYVDAMRSVDLSEVRRRAHAEAQLEDSVPEAALRAFLLQSLSLGKEGADWKLNLDALADQMHEIMGFPDHDGKFEGETLFLAGGASDYVHDDHHDRIRWHFPEARIERIPGAGHWLHAEKPREFVAEVQAFLDGSEAR